MSRLAAEQVERNRGDTADPGFLPGGVREMVFGQMLRRGPVQEDERRTARSILFWKLVLENGDGEEAEVCPDKVEGQRLHEGQFEWAW